MRRLARRTSAGVGALTLAQNRLWATISCNVNNLSGLAKKAFDTLVNGAYKPRHRS